MVFMRELKSLFCATVDHEYSGMSAADTFSYIYFVCIVGTLDKISRCPPISGCSGSMGCITLPVYSRALNC